AGAGEIAQDPRAAAWGYQSVHQAVTLREHALARSQRPHRLPVALSPARRRGFFRSRPGRQSKVGGTVSRHSNDKALLTYVMIITIRRSTICKTSVAKMALDRHEIASVHNTPRRTCQKAACWFWLGGTAR